MKVGSKGCVHINGMIDWMYLQSVEMMEGTEWENNWYWYHDALSIMWSPDTIAYIKDTYPAVYNPITKETNLSLYDRVLRGLGPTNAEFIKCSVTGDDNLVVEKWIKNRYCGKLGGDISRNMPLDSSVPRLHSCVQPLRSTYSSPR